MGNSTLVILGQWRGNEQVVGSATSDDAVGEGTDGLGGILAQVVDIDGSHVLWEDILVDIEIGVRIAIVGSDGVVDEIVLASSEVNAVRCAVADLAIDDLGIHVLYDQSVDAMIVNAAIMEIEFGQEQASSFGIGIQSDTAREDIYIMEIVGGWQLPFGVDEVDTIPLPRCHAIGYGVEEHVGAVASENDGTVGRALGIEAAIDINHCSSVHVDGGASVDSEVTSHGDGVVE